MVQKSAALQAKAEVARIRAKQKARDTRRRVVFIAAAVLAALGLIAVVWAVLAGESKRVEGIEQAARLPIEGVTELPDAPAVHVESLSEPTPTAVEETVLPPASGEHDPVVQNCGIYTEPIASAKAVHSLEHGAVWITYRTGLDQRQIDALAALANARDYTLLSPMDALAAPVVLTAWGIQLEVDNASDPRVEPFLAKYVQGEQTPEPGAPCSGGFGDPA
ncbi:MAG: hypothetical protein CVT68_05855 [Actinobacteria bacterium HGW-Actinobacteria-8]|nr:MAG: hypothetical protein CVT68_05855 [Actinobacteria bacterium HGW-Actinobacteria-8]